MIPMVPGTKVYLACHPVSMRLGFDGLMEALNQRLFDLLKEISVKSKMAKAIRYTLNHWNGLMLFLTDGRVEVDTTPSSVPCARWQRPGHCAPPLQVSVNIGS